MFKNNRIKDFFSGVLTTLIIIVLTTSVFAASQGKLIEVYYGIINDIVINKVSKMPEGDLQPFIYKGRTFVPLRFVAENLGQEVRWDSATCTIYIGETGEETAVYIGNGITHMNYQEGFGYNKYKENYGGIYKDNIGQEYSSCLSIFIQDRSFLSYDRSKAWSYIEYPLNGQYDSFKAILALTEKYKNTRDTVTFEVYADDKLIYTQKVKAGDLPKNLDLNVKNVLKVKFKVISNGDDNIEIGLFNARFIK